jgi:ribosome-binding protein aMBF1 (putative translation factor)
MIQGGRSRSGVKPVAIPLCSAAPICGAIAAVLRELREARQLSMYALAKQSGISRTMVSRVEQQRSIPTVDLLARRGTAARIDRVDRWDARG